MRTTLRLNDQLLEQAKAFALAHHTTLTQVVEDALRKSLANKRREPNRSRTELPIFSGNGLQPGVDLDSAAALLQVMDGT